MKFKIKDAVRELGKPKFYYKEPTYKHNDITIGVMDYEINNSIDFYNAVDFRYTKILRKRLRNFFNSLCGVNIMYQSGYITIRISAKTERKYGDKSNRKLAEKIVMSKIKIKLYKVLDNIVNIHVSVLQEYVQDVSILKGTVNVARNKEIEFLNTLVK